MRVCQSEEEEDCHTEKERIYIMYMFHSNYLSNTLLNSLTLMVTGSIMNSGRL
jgi:hypothetical protein